MNDIFSIPAAGDRAARLAGLYERAFAEMRRAAVSAERLAVTSPEAAAPALALAALARERGAADDPELREALAALLAHLDQDESARAEATPALEALRETLDRLDDVIEAEIRARERFQDCAGC